MIGLEARSAVGTTSSNFAKTPRIGTWNSHVVLSAEFFKAITERPVPIDLRVLQALKSSLALDIYAWLTYRSSYLETVNPGDPRFFMEVMGGSLIFAMIIWRSKAK